MTSKLDPAQFGDALSAITAKHIEDRLEGLTVDQVSVNIRESPKQVISCLLSIDIHFKFMKSSQFSYSSTLRSHSSMLVNLRTVI